MFFEWFCLILLTFNTSFINFSAQGTRTRPKETRVFVKYTFDELLTSKIGMDKWALPNSRCTLAHTCNGI